MSAVMSFMCTENNKGPRTVPCGTPDATGAQSDLTPFTTGVVSVSCFGVRVSVMFHFMFVHYTFSSVWVTELPPLGNSCPLG